MRTLRTDRTSGRLVRAAVALGLAGGLAGPGLRAQGSSGATTTPSEASGTRQHTTADFAWLAGTWAGQFPGTNAVAIDLTFQPPKGGLMTGIMRLYQDGKPQVVELISLVDAPHGIELRFRHFDDSLFAKESVYKQRMTLTRSTDSSDTFSNVVPFDRTLMSTQPRVASWTRHGPNAMTVHSDILDAQGKPGVIEVSYQRVASP